MDEDVVRAVLGIQYVWNLPQTGAVDSATAEAIGEVEWYRGYREDT